MRVRKKLFSCPGQVSDNDTTVATAASVLHEVSALFPPLKHAPEYMKAKTVFCHFHNV